MMKTRDFTFILFEEWFFSQPSYRNAERVIYNLFENFDDLPSLQSRRFWHVPFSPWKGREGELGRLDSPGFLPGNHKPPSLIWTHEWNLDLFIEPLNQEPVKRPWLETTVTCSWVLWTCFDRFLRFSLSWDQVNLPSHLPNCSSKHPWIKSILTSLVLFIWPIMLKLSPIKKWPPCNRIVTSKLFVICLILPLDKASVKDASVMRLDIKINSNSSP